MRYFFLFLLISFLMFGCGRDTAGVGDDAAAPALAPASAPADRGAKRDNQEPQKAPIETAERIGRDQMAPAEPMNAPEVTMEDVRSLSPANRNGRNQNQTQTRAENAPQQQPSQFEMAQAQGSGVIDVDKIDAEQVFSVSKTPCYGDCKQYSVTLYNTGLVVFHAKKNVGRTGYYSMMLKNFSQSELMQYFRNATADGLQTVYPVGEATPADVPATVLRYPGVDGRIQAIKVYADAPEKLQQLFDLVEEMAEQEDWKLAKG